MSGTIEHLWLASFDIGKKNFSFYIEEVNVTSLQSIEDLLQNQKYLPDGTSTSNFQVVLDKVCRSGKKILLLNSDLTGGCDKSQYLDVKIFYNMIDLLDEYSEYWRQCDAFVIEKQMSFGRRHNTMALKLGQHCWSYFAIRYGPEKILEEFPAYHKTQVLGAAKTKKITKTGKTRYKAMNKPARKKWCIAKALAILRSRGDVETVEDIQSSRKKDDLCDVICQLQAYKYLQYVKTDT